MIFMDKKDEASISIMKIIGISLIIILIFGVTVMATEIDIRSVEITMANGYKMTVVTTKTNVEEILEDNNIVVEDDEITDSNKIVITNKSEQEVQIAKLSESGVETSIDEILKSYSPIIEKIVVEQETIPYETITKDASQGSEDTKNKVIQQGEDGIREITYKVKYQNEEEIEKIKLSETVVKEPVNKIVQVQRNITSRAGSTVAKTANNNASTGTPTGPTRIFKVTAYCSCAKCCGKVTGRTASGTHAVAGQTVAASGQFAFGTKLNINGQEYTVEDRGGAIQGNRIDIYMNSHAEAVAWGVKYLPVQVVE